MEKENFGGQRPATGMQSLYHLIEDGKFKEILRLFAEGGTGPPGDCLVRSNCSIPVH